MVDTAIEDMAIVDTDTDTMESALLMLFQMLLLKLILAIFTMEDTEAMEVMVWDMDMGTVSTMARGLLMPSLAMVTEVTGMAVAMEAMDTVDTATGTVVR